MLPTIRKEAVLAGLVDAATASGARVTSGVGAVAAALASHATAISDRIESWTAGGASTIKVISGDFQPGRAIITMDGLKLRNRGNAFEMLPFAQIFVIHQLHSEKRTSTRERMKGAAAGTIVGGIGAIALMSTGPLGAAVGGTLGALLSAKRRYSICRIDLRDGRKLVAVAANTNWLALLASVPQPKSAD